jgi:hypothetical protein
VSTLNTIVKKSEEIEGNFIQCRPLSMQWETVKCPPLEELESELAAWFKEKGLHISAI